MGDKFTPGPWFYGDEDTMFGVDFVQVHAGDYGDNTFRRIANVEAPFDGECDLPMDDETRANARLIAAAPCMGAYVRKRAEAGDDEARALLARIEGGAA
jgi:hypothetical protein